MPTNTTGAWGPLKPWPFIAIHAAVLQDGRVLTFGTEDPATPGLPQKYIGIDVPEIYTPEEGWRTFTGACDTEFTSSTHGTYWYPEAWLNDDGKVIQYGAAVAPNLEHGRLWRLN